MPTPPPFRKFVDANDREHKVCFDYNVIIEGRKQELGVDLNRLLENNWEGMQKLFSDVVLMIDTLWLCCQTRGSLTPQEFAAGLRGDALERGAEALHMAIMDFYPSRQRELMEAMTTRGKSLQTTQQEIIREALDGKTTFSEAASKLEQLQESVTGKSTLSDNLTGRPQKSFAGNGTSQP